MLVLGIAGGSGSGKTSVVQKIVNQFPKHHVSVLSQDAYYRDNGDLTQEEKEKINFDHPSAIEFPLLVNHIEQLKAGKTIPMPTYSYVTCRRGEETIPVRPAEVLIVDQGVRGHRRRRTAHPHHQPRRHRTRPRPRQIHPPLPQFRETHARTLHRTHQTARRHHHPRGRQQQYRHRHPHRQNPGNTKPQTLTFVCNHVTIKSVNKKTLFLLLVFKNNDENEK